MEPQGFWIHDNMEVTGLRQERDRGDMRVENSRKAYGIVLLLLLSVLWLICPVRRAQAEEYGALELQFDEAAVGAELTLYPVASYENQTFVLSGVFEGCGVSLYDLPDAQAEEKAAEQLASLAQANGAEGITKTVDAGGALYYTELRPAYYLLVQTAGLERVEIQKMLIPVPHTEKDGTVLYDAVLTPKYSVPDGAALLHKTDDAGSPVAGAVFHLEQKVYVSADGELPAGAETGQDVGGRYFWKRVRENLTTDARGELAVEDLLFGTYRFVEAKAPEGHILNVAPNYVAVEQAGKLQETPDGYKVLSGKPEELTVPNIRTTVRVNKVDQNQNPVAGARLAVKRADGTSVSEFTSTEEATELRGLPKGDYILSELQAPDGYHVAADVPFTVSDAADAVNTVTMVDERVDETAASVTVTKTLIDQQNQMVFLEDATFYVALFEDEARTQRVTDVMELRYQGANRSSVTFTNLEFDKKYYVGETDQSGALLEGQVSGNGIFAPQYPTVFEVTPTRTQPTHEFEFQNMYYELPDDGYYYGGELTITKKVLRGSEDYNIDAVFYAALFEDAAHTKRYGDIITLDMDGGCEYSVTIPVSIGDTPNSSETYYVAETDQNGKVLDPSSGLAFTVSVDKSEVTMTPQTSEQTVTITNRYPENTPTGDNSDTPIGSSGDSGTLSGSSSGSSSPVRTGDETPIALYVGMLAAAAAVIVILLIVKKKRRR